MKNNYLAGQCYIVSEALYHMLGGKAAGWKPIRMRHEGVSHWALMNEQSGIILDMTMKQFKTMPNYAKAVGCGFLTKKPSKRAKLLISLMQK